MHANGALRTDRAWTEFALAGCGLIWNELDAAGSGSPLMMDAWADLDFAELHSELEEILQRPVLDDDIHRVLAFIPTATRFASVRRRVVLLRVKHPEVRDIPSPPESIDHRGRLLAMSGGKHKLPADTFPVANSRKVVPGTQAQTYSRLYLCCDSRSRPASSTALVDVLKPGEDPGSFRCRTQNFHTAGQASPAQGYEVLSADCGW